MKGPNSTSAAAEEAQPSSLNFYGRIDTSLAGTIEKIFDHLHNQPSYFTPYKTFPDFAHSLFSPVSNTFALSALIALSTARTFVAVSFFFGSLLFAAPLTLIGKHEAASNFTNTALQAGVNMVAEGLYTAVLIPIFAITAPEAIARLLTRTVTSIVNAISPLELTAEEGNNLATTV